jgi:hypothetical protein
VLYLYAISDTPAQPDIAGLCGTPLRTVGEEGLVAVVSEHEALEIRASEDALWSHERVVETLMDRASVLPVRLGTMLTDEAAVLGSLRERRRELESALEHVRGAVELGVRATPSAETFDEPQQEEAGATGPGTAYMQARLSRQRRGEDVAKQIHDPLAALARASTARLNARERLVLNAAYLVDRARVEDFMARVHDLDAQSEARIVCTGPWPPYSFSSGSTQR